MGRCYLMSEEFLQFAQHLATKAREIIESEIGAKPSVDEKPDASLVTSADTNIEEAFRELIRKKYPDHGIIGEEFPQENPQSPIQWILDPIDGTEEFVYGLPTYGTLIGVYENDTPLAGVIDHPALDMQVYASKGGGAFCDGIRIHSDNHRKVSAADQVRFYCSRRKNFMRYNDDGPVYDALVKHFPNTRTFASCLEFAGVAMGAAHLGCTYNAQAWDFAATEVVMLEAGLVYEPIAITDRGDGITSYSAFFGDPKWVAEAAAITTT